MGAITPILVLIKVIGISRQQLVEVQFVATIILQNAQLVAVVELILFCKKQFVFTNLCFNILFLFTYFFLVFV